jgi:hypothetical protein
MTHVIFVLVYNLYIYIYIYNFIKTTFSIFIIFRVKNTFEPNVFKWIIKKKIISSSLFALLIINVKILYNFKRNGAHLVEKKDI